MRKTTTSPWRKTIGNIEGDIDYRLRQELQKNIDLHVESVIIRGVFREVRSRSPLVLLRVEKAAAELDFLRGRSPF